MLSNDLKTLLATQYAFVVKAQFFHWNVEGAQFVELHKLYGDIYADVYGAIDPTAEYIRTLDDYAPGSFERFTELTQIQGQTKVPKSRLMTQELLADNQTMIDLLNTTFQSAQQEKQEGIANFIAERLDAHGKHGWMLRSLLRDR